MISRQDFIVRARIEVTVLDQWIAAGWLVPHHSDHDLTFAEVDLARARLIRELRDDFGVNAEGIEIVLDLIDQMHGLRRSVRTLAAELRAARGGQPRR
jgi:chaperone modulatory protein CbpM